MGVTFDKLLGENLMHSHKGEDVKGGIVGGVKPVNAVSFDTTFVDGHQEGRLQWNSDDGTLEYGLAGNNVNLQIGQEIVVKVSNGDTGTITNGTVVTFVGSQGSRPKAYRCIAGDPIYGHPCGVATEDIVSNGYVTTNGLVRDIDTSGLSVGVVYANGTGGLTSTRPSVPSEPFCVGMCLVSGVGNGLLYVNPQNVKYYSEIDTRYLKLDDYNDRFPFGFVIDYAGNQETTISFDGTNTFTLAPTGTTWSYWRNGVKYTITGSKTCTLSATPPATAGNYYIYIDSTDGTLACSTSEWTLADTKVPVVHIDWDNAATPKYWMSDERHSCAIDRRFHWEHHFTDGTEIRTTPTLSGYTVTPAVPATTDNTFAISQAVAIDEDISHTAAAVADPNGVTKPYVIWYRTATSTWNWVYSEVPYRYTAAGYIQYDNAGTMTEGASGNFYNTYLLVTSIEGDAAFSFIHGQSQYATLALAQAESFSSLTKTGLGIDEYVAVYQLTWGTGAGYSSLGKCRLAAAPKAISVSASGVTSGGSVEHNTLAGLQGGTTGEYYHLTSAEYTAAQAVPTTYLKLDASNDPMTGSLSFEGNAAKTLTVDRHTTTNTAGNDFTVTAGGATVGATDKSGGSLVLSGGTSTGTGNSAVKIFTATAGTTGTADRAPAEMARFYKSSSTSYVLTLNSTTTGATANGVNIFGGANAYVGMVRHTTANTAGAGLTVQAGGATSGATDKNGGNITIKPGVSTGTGTASIVFQTPDAASTTGTADNAFTTKMQIFGNGQQSLSANMANIASGATSVFGYTTNILPLTNSSTEFRALYFQNLVPNTGAVTLNIIEGGFFENRIRTAAQITSTVGIYAEGFKVDSSSTATAAITTSRGMQVLGSSRPSGTTTVTATTITGADITAVNGSGVTSTTINGILINDSVAGSFTTQLGIDIASQTRAATNIGIRIAAPSGGATANYALQLSDTGGTAAGGITFGTDTTLYRSAADTLKTDDSLIIVGDLTLSSSDIITDTGTGTKIGTGATQKLGFWNATPVAQSTGWTTSNVTTDKSFDANATTLDEVADVLGTLIEQLKTYGILG